MNKKIIRYILVILIFLVLQFSLFSFYFYNEFRPNGDSYMSVLWSQLIENEKSTHFDVYDENSKYWGKEGEIYFTPLLHIINFSAGGIIGIGYESVVFLFLIIFSFILFGLLYIFFKKISVTFTIFSLIIYSTSFMRDKRYFIIPGYHYQNMFGDIFFIVILFLMYLIIKTYKEKDKIHWRYILIIGLSFNATILYHQLTAFIIFFILIFLMIFIFFYFKLYRRIYTSLTKKKLFFLVPLFLIFLVYIIFDYTLYGRWFLSIFTNVPKDSLLYLEMRPFMNYGSLLGSKSLFYLFLLALPSLLIYFLLRLKDNYDKLSIFVLPTIVILILTKGPLLNILTFPLRTLWFLSYFLIFIGSFYLFLLERRMNTRVFLIIFVMLIILIANPLLPDFFKESNPRNIDFTDSAPTLEIKEISNVILENSKNGDVLRVRALNCRSCIWIKTFIFPYKKLYFWDELNNKNDIVPDIVIFDKNNKEFLKEKNYDTLYETDNFIVKKKRS